MTSTRVIGEGDQVLLKRDNKSAVFRVQRDRHLHFEKAKFQLNGIIGHPFGATFKVKDGEMLRVGDADEVLNEIMDAEAQDCESGKDNRNLVAAGSNQKLSQGDILKMKEDGKSGEEIIQELVTNSETFDSKTEYSQRKYLKKKLKKHVFIFTVLRPTARLLIDMVYTKTPEKICNLRIDSLSQILAYANIMSGINVAIIDTLQGLVVGSVMERMGGLGRVVQFYPGSDLNRHILEFFDFPREFKANLYNYPLSRLHELKARKHETVQSAENGGKICSGADKVTMAESDVMGDNSTPGITGKESETVTGGTEEEMIVDESVDSDTVVGEKRKGDPSQESSKKQEKSKTLDLVKGFIQEKSFDCLIVACKFHPTPIVLGLLEYVAASRPVVVYSLHKEPLVDCYTCLKEQGGVLNLRLTETWYREYQVLPARTHPTMQMTGTGGYLLTFTTVTS